MGKRIVDFGQAVSVCAIKDADGIYRQQHYSETEVAEDSGYDREGLVDTHIKMRRREHGKKRLR
jgi:hypothetical protein